MQPPNCSGTTRAGLAMPGSHLMISIKAATPTGVENQGAENN